ncbi:unnamed protein product [Caretta caretta]
MKSLARLRLRAGPAAGRFRGTAWSAVPGHAGSLPLHPSCATDLEPLEVLYTHTALSTKTEHLAFERNLSSWKHLRRGKLKTMHTGSGQAKVTHSITQRDVPLSAPHTCALKLVHKVHFPLQLEVFCGEH